MSGKRIGGVLCLVLAALLVGYGASADRAARASPTAAGRGADRPVPTTLPGVAALFLGLWLLRGRAAPPARRGLGNRPPQAHDDEDAPADREGYMLPPPRDGEEPHVRMKCRACEQYWLKPADEQARRCPSCGGLELVQLPSLRGQVFIGLLAGLGCLGLMGVAVAFTNWKGGAVGPGMPAGPGAVAAPAPADEGGEVTHDLAALSEADALALAGRRHRFRVVVVGDFDDAGGCVCFDCAGADDLHRAVWVRKGLKLDEEVESFVVEARVRVIVYGDSGPFGGFVEVRLVDAVPAR